jgi:hypothetical protein
MRTIFTRIGKILAGVAIAAALFAGASVPARAQTMTALSATTNYTLVPLAGTVGQPTTNGVIIVGSGGSLTMCSGFINVPGLLNFVPLYVPSGSCGPLGHISTPISNWTFVVQGAMVSFMNQITGNLYRCSGYSVTTLASIPPQGSCQDLGTIPR